MQIRRSELWDIVIAITTVCMAIEIPLRVGLYRVAMWPAYEWLYTFLLCLDIVFSLAAPVPKSRARRTYFWQRRPWLVVDVLAAVPFGLLFPTSSGLLRLLPLHRLIKFAVVIDRLNHWRMHHFLNPSLYRLTVFVFWISLFAHTAACGWLMFTGINAEHSLWEQYVDALYWTITTLTTVGYGDITPTGSLQKLYTIGIMMAGVASYGYVIGNLAGLLAQRDMLRARQLRRIEEMSTLLQYRAVPVALRQRVQNYYGHLWEAQLDLNEKALLADLPTDLQDEILAFLHRSLIQKVPFFQKASYGFIKEIIHVLQPVVLTPGTVFIRQGDIGDCMYFISSGTIEVVERDTQCVLATLNDGDFVGEMALLSQEPRNADVRTVDYCDLYVLTKTDFQTILRRHPAFAQHLQTVSSQRIHERHHEPAD